MLDYTKRVQVYFNLHTHRFSVRQGGRVVMHTDALNLYDARFLVRPAGRAKVLATGQKNVHAFVTGLMRDYSMDRMVEVPVTYNPYKFATFVSREDQTPVLAADYVVLANVGKPTITASRSAKLSYNM